MVESVQLRIGERVTVRKLNYAGEAVYGWSGVLLQTGVETVIHALFPTPKKEPPVVDGVPFLPGDVFTEFYYADRWYNVFHIADPAGKPKGWYCNVAQPAQIDAEGIAFVDMKLDLFAHPDGRYAILDEDEFAEAVASIYLPEHVRAARAGLSQLVRLAEAGQLPSPESLPQPGPSHPATDGG